MGRGAWRGVSSQVVYLLEVQVDYRNKVQRMCVMVIIWAAVPAVHPQLDQSAFTWDHVHCIPPQLCCQPLLLVLAAWQYFWPPAFATTLDITTATPEYGLA